MKKHDLKAFARSDESASWILWVGACTPKSAIKKQRLETCSHNVRVRFVRTMCAPCDARIQRSKSMIYLMFGEHLACKIGESNIPSPHWETVGEPSRTHLTTSKKGGLRFQYQSGSSSLQVAENCSIGEVELSKHCRSTFHVIIIPVWMSPTGLELRHKYLAVWPITADAKIMLKCLEHAFWLLSRRPFLGYMHPRKESAMMIPHF